MDPPSKRTKLAALAAPTSHPARAAHVAAAAHKKTFSRSRIYVGRDVRAPPPRQTIRADSRPGQGASLVLGTFSRHRKYGLLCLSRPCRPSHLCRPSRFCRLCRLCHLCRHFRPSRLVCLSLSLSLSLSRVVSHVVFRAVSLSSLSSLPSLLVSLLPLAPLAPLSLSFSLFSSPFVFLFLCLLSFFSFFSFLSFCLFQQHCLNRRRHFYAHPLSTTCPVHSPT